MLILPGGQLVGITSERARYHATRKNIRITRNTPHKQLYKLVDVIYPDKHNDPALLKKNFRFSGHTLADECWIKSLAPEDRDCISDWIKQTDTRNKIEEARRKLIYDDLPHKVRSFSYPDLLHSTVYELIQALPMTVATVKQWYRTVLNLQKAGVRKEELQWSGLMGFFKNTLKDSDRKITKQDILKAIDFSSTRLELTNELVRDESDQLCFDECAKRLPLAAVWQAGIDAGCTDRAVLRYCNAIFNYRIAYLKANARCSPLIGDKRWFALDSYGHALTDTDSKSSMFDSLDEAKKVINRHAVQNYGLKNSLISKSKYQYISLYGGEDYREWLLTLPDYQHSYFSSHFTERNVLLHIRTKTRHDTKQRKLLFIEEIQSDWHQVIKNNHNRRYRMQTPSAPFRTEWVSLALKLMLIHAAEEAYDGVAWADGALQAFRYHNEIPAVLRLYDKTIPLQLMKLGRPWQGDVTATMIETKNPWLRIARIKDKWQVKNDNHGFVTRPKKTREEAVSIVERHSKTMSLQVPVFLVPAEMAQHIKAKGLPLFGERID